MNRGFGNVKRRDYRQQAERRVEDSLPMRILEILQDSGRPLEMAVIVEQLRRRYNYRARSHYDAVNGLKDSQLVHIERPDHPWCYAAN